MIEKLKQVQKNSYSSVSNFPVAAILIDNDGNEYYGVNVELAIPSLSLCAERNALFSALTMGKKPGDFKEIHIIGGNEKGYVISPCGACRQVLIELMDSDAIVYSYSNNDSPKIIKTKISDLISRPFVKRDIK